MGSSSPAASSFGFLISLGKFAVIRFLISFGKFVVFGFLISGGKFVVFGFLIRFRKVIVFVLAVFSMFVQEGFYEKIFVHREYMQGSFELFFWVFSVGCVEMFLEMLLSVEIFEMLVEEPGVEILQMLVEGARCGDIADARGRSPVWRSLRCSQRRRSKDARGRGSVWRSVRCSWKGARCGDL